MCNTLTTFTYDIHTGSQEYTSSSINMACTQYTHRHQARHWKVRASSLMMPRVHWVQKSWSAMARADKTRHI